MKKPFFQLNKIKGTAILKLTLVKRFKIYSKYKKKSLKKICRKKKNSKKKLFFVKMKN